MFFLPNVSPCGFVSDFVKELPKSLTKPQGETLGKKKKKNYSKLHRTAVIAFVASSVHYWDTEDRHHQQINDERENES